MKKRERLKVRLTEDVALNEIEDSFEGLLIPCYNYEQKK